MFILNTKKWYNKSNSHHTMFTLHIKKLYNKISEKNSEGFTLHYFCKVKNIEGYTPHHFFIKKNGAGYITLISVLVVGAVGIAISTSLILLGLGSARISFAVEQSNQAKALANACVEEGLQQIRDSMPYTGSGNLTLGQGTCSYTVASQGGQNRTITAIGTVGTIMRKVKVIIDKINPAIQVVSWQEVVDF
jgi:hypothetical protein